MATTRMTFLRPFTTHLFNPISRRFADRLPGFAILSYVGRKTGTLYRTPINVFKRDDIYIFALTTAPRSTGSRTCSRPASATCAHAGRDVHLVEPELFTDPTRHLMPLVVRVVLRFNDVQDFLQMRPA